MEKKGFNIKNHIHFGYMTYKEYFYELGITEEKRKYMTSDEIDEYAKKVEERIAENARKYIDIMINEGFVYTFDDIQELIDIKSRNTIQTKFIPRLQTMYITKPCRDLMYSMFFGLDFYYYDFISWVCPIKKEKDLRMGKFVDEKSWEIERADRYKFEDIRKKGVTRDRLRKKMWFTSKDLVGVIKENFKLDKGFKEYEELDDMHIERIFEHGLLSETTIKNKLGLVNVNQIQRRILNGEIDLLFKVSMPNESEVKRDLMRYCCLIKEE